MHYVGNIIASGIKDAHSFVPTVSLIYFRSYKTENNRKNISSVFLSVFLIPKKSIKKVVKFQKNYSECFYRQKNLLTLISFSTLKVHN